MPFGGYVMSFLAVVSCLLDGFPMSFWRLCRAFWRLLFHLFQPPLSLVEDGEKVGKRVGTKHGDTCLAEVGDAF